MNDNQVDDQSIVEESPAIETHSDDRVDDSSMTPPSEEKEPVSIDTGMNSPASPELANSIQQLLGEMRELRRDFETKLMYDENKQCLIDSLHSELQGHREGLHFKILHPIFLDMIDMHDDLGKLAEALPTKYGEAVLEDMLNNLRSFQETIEEILERNGVVVSNAEGDVFVPGRQRAIKALDTSDPMLDKQIARRVRKGFEYDGKVLRPELVEIYKLC